MLATPQPRPRLHSGAVRRKRSFHTERRSDQTPERFATRASGTVVYVSSNGAGMGHLTRLMALARHAAPGVRPLVISMSQAVPVVAVDDLDYEYIPSRGDLGIGARRWNVLFRRRFVDVLEQERPAAIVFDGTYPYDGLFAARRVLPGAGLVWSRRGMWRPGLGRRQLARSPMFDLVIEPGEYAAAADGGATADRADAMRVAPITLLGRHELLSREDAAAALGCDPAGPVALVTLGAGNVGDLDCALGRLVEGLLRIDGLQVVVTRPLITDSRASLPARVLATSMFPISHALRAIDLAVAAPGYNAFHELLAFAIPTAFVPNRHTALDDQRMRAVWAESVGVGLHIPEIDDAGVARVVAELGSSARREELAARCRSLPPPDGALQSQRAVEELMARVAVS